MCPLTVQQETRRGCVCCGCRPNTVSCWTAHSHGSEHRPHRTSYTHCLHPRTSLLYAHTLCELCAHRVLPRQSNKNVGSFRCFHTVLCSSAGPLASIRTISSRLAQLFNIHFTLYYCLICLHRRRVVHHRAVVSSRAGRIDDAAHYVCQGDVAKGAAVDDLQAAEARCVQLRSHG